MPFTRLFTRDADAPPFDAVDEVMRLSRAGIRVAADVLNSDAPPLEVVQRYCDAMVQASAHLCLAWCWFGQAEAPVIRPLVSAGRASEWARQMRIERNWLTRKGPAFRTVDTGQSETVEISRFAVWGPWRRLAQEHHVRAVRCIPLRGHSAQRSGILVVYADAAGYFDVLGHYFDELGQLFTSVLLNREAAEASANHYLHRLELAAEVGALGIWELDLTTLTFTADQRLTDMMALPPNTFENRMSAALERIHPEDRERVQAALDRAAAHEPPISVEFRVVFPDGQTRYVLGRAIGLRDRAGKAVKLVGANVDITDQKRVEETLQRARDAAVTASQAKSDFLANMSHEIRTPMNGVMGMSALAFDLATDPVQREYLSLVRSSGEGLMGVINEILDFSKIEAGHMHIEMSEFVVRTWLDEITLPLELRAREKGLALVVETAPDLAPALRTDALRLRQIVNNLVGNAIKFTAQGQVTLRLHAVERGGAGSLTLGLDVIDTGIGIALEKQQLIFEPFSQADGSITRQFGGTGLGLSICHRLCSLLGGTIGLESTVGQGTIFRVRLPVVAVPLSSVHPQPPEPKPMSATPPAPVRTDVPGSSLRILLAEDHPVNQKVAQIMLTKSGHVVEVAGDGAQAVEAARRGCFDLILMDMQMPVLDGLEATRRIRAEEAEQQRPRVTIIAMTANAREEDRQVCLAAGMDDFVSKPIRMATLVEKLQAL
ncbi:ATP-binding protein [uncultured Hydrogenophaga sp.]|uniref:hybrid sensor histidine kinase/response regulator n=1 Tax=uncultured Hydrogenophaga sp. TaxID=199683 RepID=UPI00265DFB29|nr:ATP-binding protein [uncultured Hydrogenophaga sp.]